MLQISQQSKILLAIQPIDFRKGIDSISALCRQTLEQDPMSGVLFVFRNRLKTALRILCYDGQGFFGYAPNGLSSGRFKWWPTGSHLIDRVGHKELYTLIYNGNPASAKFGSDWKPLLS